MAPARTTRPDRLHGIPGDAGTTGAGDDVPEAARALRERWFACSSALGWSAPDEWPDAAVDAVCVAVTARPRSDRGAEQVVERALARWAGARAGAGVGLAETLSDLAALHTAVAAPREVGADDRPSRGPDGARLLRVVSLAWTDVACGDLAETAAVDPLSGLASVRYLRTRLAELYRGARARGTRVGDEHALVTVGLDVRGWGRVAPLTVAGEAAAVVFDAGESLAVVGRSTVVVLAPRAGLAERTRVLRRLLARRLGGRAGAAVVGTAASPPSVRIVALPATHDGACAALERLRDTDRPDRPASAAASGEVGAASGGWRR